MAWLLGYLPNLAGRTVPAILVRNDIDKSSGHQLGDVVAQLRIAEATTTYLQMVAISEQSSAWAQEHLGVLTYWFPPGFGLYHIAFLGQVEIDLTPALRERAREIVTPLLQAVLSSDLIGYVLQAL